MGKFYHRSVIQILIQMIMSFNEDNLMNRVIQANYEMGSTFKPLTAVNGFDYGIIDPSMVLMLRKV